MLLSHRYGAHNDENFDTGYFNDVYRHGQSQYFSSSYCFWDAKALQTTKPPKTTNTATTTTTGTVTTALVQTVSLKITQLKYVLIIFEALLPPLGTDTVTSTVTTTAAASCVTPIGPFDVTVS
jgi:hypothetical protein